MSPEEGRYRLSGAPGLGFGLDGGLRDGIDDRDQHQVLLRGNQLGAEQQPALLDDTVGGGGSDACHPQQPHPVLRLHHCVAVEVGGQRQPRFQVGHHRHRGGVHLAVGRHHDQWQPGQRMLVGWRILGALRNVGTPDLRHGQQIDRTGDGAGEASGSRQLVYSGKPGAGGRGAGRAAVDHTAVGLLDAIAAGQCPNLVVEEGIDDAQHPLLRAQPQQRVEASAQFGDQRIIGEDRQLIGAGSQRQQARPGVEDHDGGRVHRGGAGIGDR